MKSFRIPYNQLVSIMVDQKERMAEDHIQSPFENADDRKLSGAAGEYLKLYIQDLQRYRHGRSPDPFVRTLSNIGYQIGKMKKNDLDDLVVDLDDFALRLSTFADHLLSPFDESLYWSNVTVNVDDSAEEVILALGRDRRIDRYYEMSKEISDLKAGVRVPQIIEEIADLEGINSAFESFVDNIFNQVTDPAIAAELKKKMLDHLSQKR